MKEGKFKTRLTWYILISKIFVILYILFEYSVKGYTGEQTFAIISLIIPLFAVYLTAMVKDISEHRFVETEKVEDLEVKKSFVRLSNFLFFIYPLSIIIIIYMGAELASFKLTQSGIAIIESGLGVYIGQIVFSMFKKAK